MSKILHKKWTLSLDKLSSETRLAVYTVSLYATFMLWGYLQEKITSTTVTYNTEYSDRRHGTESINLTWDYPFFLNVCMAAVSYTTSCILESYSEKVPKIPLKLFWRPALAATIASPLGYTSLKYINYPLMVLTKSSKPVPIMLIGSIFFKQVYQWYKYCSVALLCIGISTFTFAQSSSKNKMKENTDNNNEYNILYSLFGVFLILINLSLDGYTNNEQDRLYNKHSITATQMMKYFSLWQFIFQISYLFINAIIYGYNSQLYSALYMIRLNYSLGLNIVLFCVCASGGQILVYRLVKEYGSLVWVMISVTRQLFTIMLSVVLFGHKVNRIQWIGVILVFIGLVVDINSGFIEKLRSVYGWDGSVLSLWGVLQRSLQDTTTATSSSTSSSSSSNSTGISRSLATSTSMEFVDIEQPTLRGRNILPNTHFNGTNTTIRTPVKPPPRWNIDKNKATKAD